MDVISLKNICKSYDKKEIFRDFNCQFEKGKITVILGESGCGKTTLLNIMSNQTKYSGNVSGIPDNTAFVFQRNMLVKNLTVGQNLTLINKEINVKEELALMGLNGTENTYPKDLSAGMARRVNILRAFCFPSDVLLMDEPFINLDVSLKLGIIERIKEINNSQNKTVIMVTHDIYEASMIADEIKILKNGQIIKSLKKQEEKAPEYLFDVMIKCKD